MLPPDVPELEPPIMLPPDVPELEPPIVLPPDVPDGSTVSMASPGDQSPNPTALHADTFIS